MSYYNSSSSSSSSHFFGHNSFSSYGSSYYNDMYRSYSNLRSLPQSYSQPYYLPGGPYSSVSSYTTKITSPSSPSFSKPCCKHSKSPCLARSVKVVTPSPTTTTTVSEKLIKTTISEIYSKTDEESPIKLSVNFEIPPVRNSNNRTSPVHMQANEQTHQSANESTISAQPSDQLSSQGQSQEPSQGQSQELPQEPPQEPPQGPPQDPPQGPPQNPPQGPPQEPPQEPPQGPPQDPPQKSQFFNESNDVNATAISSVRLNCTDDLTTQVDYYLNEVDNRMICRGKTVELESFELSGKSGLISKCLYLNELLTEANLSETNLECDPIFGATDTGKCSLLFLSVKDAEAFANSHSDKFTVIFTNEIEKSKLPTRKNVSFTESNDDNNESESNNKSKSILKTNSNQLFQSKSCDSISSKATVGLANHLRNDSNSNDNLNSVNNSLENPSNVLVSTNSSKKSKTEGYEILTIRAKLKQRVGQNRSKPVDLHDIDSIMRNVVTIIQDEFMKRFPSGQSPNAINTN